MRDPHVLIIGGGLAGLSAGTYARASGFRTTIVEQSDALGGVCAAWTRAPYHIDGCIRWLCGGPFEKIYRELEILPSVAMQALPQLTVYRNAADGTEVEVGQDLDCFARALTALSPADASEIALLIDVARKVAAMDPGIAQPAELMSFRSSMAMLWNMRGVARGVLHFGKDLSAYVSEHIESPTLRRLLCRLVPSGSSAILLALMLGNLERGQLIRPIGGSRALRDALVHAYQRAGGEAILDAMVEEVLVRDRRARGVRLADGSILEADYVISTSSLPETLLSLLGGQFGIEQHGLKLEQWKMFGPLLLISYGVALPLTHVPRLLHVDQVEPFHVGGRAEDHLDLRVFNDEPDCAPPGHTVVQTMLATDYDYWATRRRGYTAAKDRIAATVLSAIDRQLPGVEAAVRMTDVATPLTFWRVARSWRGAYEGWQQNRESLFGHIDKRLAGLSHFYLAGQWVEPGGGVPVTLLSGRHAVQLMCAEARQLFVAGVC